MTSDELYSAQSECIKEMVTTWASVIDLVLQDVLRVRGSGDIVQQACGYAKVAQTSIMMHEYFAMAVQVFMEGVDDDTHAKMIDACTRANKVIASVMQNKIDELTKRAEALVETDASKALVQSLIEELPPKDVN